MDKKKVFYSDSNDVFWSCPPTEFTILKLISKNGYEDTHKKISKLLRCKSLLRLFSMFDYVDELNIDMLRNETKWAYTSIVGQMEKLVDLGLVRGYGFDNNNYMFRRWRLR